MAGTLTFQGGGILLGLVPGAAFSLKARPHGFDNCGADDLKSGTMDQKPTATTRRRHGDFPALLAAAVILGWAAVALVAVALSGAA